LHGSPPAFVFYGSGTIFLPPALSGKRVVMAGPSETKLQHLAAFSGGRRALAVTGLTIHDNVMRDSIPAAGLLQ
jgi:hypothetical protein